jgi:hypothetical protein
MQLLRAKSALLEVYLVRNLRIAKPDHLSFEDPFYSWSWRWDDRGCLCRHTLRNDQVRTHDPNPPSHAHPTRSTRTKLIEDAKRPNPQYRGLTHGVTTIVRQEGLLGIYRGLFPVVRPHMHNPFAL